MRRNHIASPKLQSQLDSFNAKEIKVGEGILIKGKYLRRSNSRNLEMEQHCIVKEVNGDTIVVYNGYNAGDTCEVAKENCTKDTFFIGANPFTEEEWHRRIRTNNFSLECIILKFFKEDTYIETRKDGSKYTLDLLNWNPYVYNKEGNREYYQRDFVWTTKDKQLFIDSIYNRLNCGQILVRKRSEKWLRKEAENGEDVVYEWDIVDGKQRLHTIYEFINNKFPDSYGNYWNDLSDYARFEFEDSMSLTYAEMAEESTDEDVIKAFLGVNFTGVPMSKEHIDYVKEINGRL